MKKGSEEISIKGNIVDVLARKIFPGEIIIEGNIIKRINRLKETLNGFILPGLVDAHIHIESSMVAPVEFSKSAIKNGTVAVVSDPHEIANVLGVEGVDFMIENAKGTPLKILFGAPSCVPATTFENAGAVIGPEEVKELLQRNEIGYLSEMMNYPGVVFGDEDVLRKLSYAKELGLPVDGHAPGLKGEDLVKYVQAGISTDHECFTIDEAKEKISLGMKVLIREGSGAKNLSSLKDLYNENPEMLMLCSDDLHPDDLENGHINILVKELIKEGYELFDVLRSVTLNPKMHYNLNNGLLQQGDAADFLIIDSFEDFNILSTYIDGKEYFNGKDVKIEAGSYRAPNRFDIESLKMEDIQVREESKTIRVIEAIDGELITREFHEPAKIQNGYVVSNPSKDILKIVVQNRYARSKPAVAFIKGFGLEKGALASSIAHDSHNIICVGCSDREIVETMNWIIQHKGGIAVHDGKEVSGLQLDIAGIMSSTSVEKASQAYHSLSIKTGDLGSKLKAPFMTLAFMALLVIPDLKLSDKGLFDGRTFSYTSVFV